MLFSESARRVMRLASPFLSFGGFALLLVAGAWLIDGVMRPPENGWQSSYLDDAVSVVGILFCGAVLFAVDRGIVDLEGPSRHSGLGHVRRCSVFYGLFVVLLVIVMSDYVASRTVTTYRQEVATPTVYWLLFVGYPILLDASVLARRWRQCNQTTFGGAS
ncbi:MAG: hypothetical protein M3479_04750 [Actinomycetota bacterium]|nr:hypothetical protein [Rubrobacteraceae bacterium]MBA3792124.1 hypothetical protein [Rubrobacter sp.]MDQ3315877.1 hypothetical protein [Actinomycetota bacterium]MDQ3429237.1 hypothetical protein [Actinomycetota bacterium]